MTTLMLALMQVSLSAGAQPLNVTEIVDHMVQAENERTAAFSGYTGMRRYHFENKKFGKRAEVTVRVKCDPAGAKNFEVLEESGSGFVRSHIIRRMVDAEHQASAKGDHEQTRILPDNYQFSLVGTEVVDGRPAYVLQIDPKTKNQFLVRGRIWVDTEDFAIMRVEGSPAKNPSFWIHSVKVVQRYERFGKFWLPVNNASRADARVFGATNVDIEYFDYLIDEGHSNSSAIPGNESGSETAQ
jgi:hypothetical protein